VALFAYKCTAKYNARAEAGIPWNNADIGTEWPVDPPVISEKDRTVRSSEREVRRTAAQIQTLARTPGTVRVLGRNVRWEIVLG
jgi:dTDP-4-dehydrorhamnose 3,5-epimerase